MQAGCRAADSVPQAPRHPFRPMLMPTPTREVGGGGAGGPRPPCGGCASVATTAACPHAHPSLAHRGQVVGQAVVGQVRQRVPQRGQLPVQHGQHPRGVDRVKHQVVQPAGWASKGGRQGAVGLQAGRQGCGTCSSPGCSPGVQRPMLCGLALERPQVLGCRPKAACRARTRGAPTGSLRARCAWPRGRRRPWGCAPPARSAAAASRASARPAAGVPRAQQGVAGTELTRGSRDHQRAPAQAPRAPNPPLPREPPQGPTAHPATALTHPAAVAPRPPRPLAATHLHHALPVLLAPAPDLPPVVAARLAVALQADLCGGHAVQRGQRSRHRLHTRHEGRGVRVGKGQQREQQP